MKSGHKLTRARLNAIVASTTYIKSGRELSWFIIAFVLRFGNGYKIFCKDCQAMFVPLVVPAIPEKPQDLPCTVHHTPTGQFR